ncbi:MAG: hypothetical protein M1839_006504 [Geoglossum umbratile]|nr:MAG: hypothetical protein M1839_006504 [Geoglossum umbratile]
MHLFSKLSVLLVVATACASPARLGGPRRRQDGNDYGASTLISTVTVAPYPYPGTGAPPPGTGTSPITVPTSTDTSLPTAVTGTGSGMPQSTVITKTTDIVLTYQTHHGTSTGFTTTTLHRTITETVYHTQFVTIPEPEPTPEPSLTAAAVGDQTTQTTTTVTTTSTYTKVITVYPNESQDVSPQNTAGNSGCASPVTVTVTAAGSTATVVCL